MNEELAVESKEDLIAQAFVAPALEKDGTGSGTRDIELLVLEAAAQDYKDSDLEASTANQRYLVSKVRLKLMQPGAGDMITRHDLKQFDSWSFSRKLAYASTNASGPLNHRPGQGFLTRGELRDRLQDRHQDPWTKAKSGSEQEVVRKPSGPQVYDLTFPPKAKQFTRM